MWRNWLAHKIVILGVVGSSPITHPLKKDSGSTAVFFYGLKTVHLLRCPDSHIAGLCVESVTPRIYTILSPLGMPGGAQVRFAACEYTEGMHELRRAEGTGGGGLDACKKR